MKSLFKYLWLGLVLVSCNGKSSFDKKLFEVHNYASSQFQSTVNELKSTSSNQEYGSILQKAVDESSVVTSGANDIEHNLKLVDGGERYRDAVIHECNYVIGAISVMYAAYHEGNYSTIEEMKGESAKEIETIIKNVESERANFLKK